MQNATQFKKVNEYIEDARKNGKIIAGGKPHNGRGYFMRPTIVRDIPDNARLVQEEQFGPVLPVLRYAAWTMRLRASTAQRVRPGRHRLVVQ